MTLEERQRRRRAAGETGTAGLLAGLPAALREYGAWLVDAPGEPAPPADPVKAAAELRDAIGALRMLNARRELARIAAFLEDDPDHPHAAHWRERFAELTGYVLRLERSGAVRPRPWQQVLAREDAAPPRRPRLEENDG